MITTEASGTKTAQQAGFRRANELTPCERCGFTLLNKYAKPYVRTMIYSGKVVTSAQTSVVRCPVCWHETEVAAR